MNTPWSCLVSWSLRLAVLVAAAAAMPAGAVELRGFRGFAWGADADTLGEAQRVSSEGGVQCYRRERENLLYGDNPIREVRYCFHDDRLFLVVVDSEVDASALAAEFESTYGPPTQRAKAWSAWGDATTPVRVEIAGAPASMRIWSNEHAPHERHASQAR
jgi:hypothetical protein